MLYSKLQAIDFFLKELEANYQKKKYRLVINFNNQIWTADFLKPHKSYPGSYVATTSLREGFERPVISQTPIDSLANLDSTNNIREFRDIMLEGARYSLFAQYLNTNVDEEFAFNELNRLADKIESPGTLPNALYNLKKLGDDKITLPFAQIPENELTWVSIVIEDIEQN